MPLVELPNGYKVVFEAIDATTGGNVGGVSVRNVTVTVDAPVPVPNLEVKPFVPVFVYGVPSNGNG